LGETRPERLPVRAVGNAGRGGAHERDASPATGLVERQRRVGYDLSMLRFFTAGESHGPALTAIVEGFPAGVPISVESIDWDLARRQQGYGRGGRMKIERDQVQLRSGIRFGESLGAPITLVVENRDWKNWTGKMSPLAADRDPKYVVTRPRPGHA